MAACRQAPILAAAAAAVALGLMLLASAVASAWVFYVDDRRPSQSALVGQIEVQLPEGRSRGTAVLVDGCGVLTNFHVVFGPWYVTARRLPSPAFPGTFILTEVTLPDGTHPTSRATPFVWGDARPAGDAQTNPDEDWAYLVLDDCLGAAHGHFDLRPLGPVEARAVGRRFVSVGYSTGRQMIDPSCSIYDDRQADRRGGWPHDCALMGGDSGGPIFRRGTREVVALSRGRLDYNRCQARAAAGEGGAVLDAWDDRCANVAVPITAEILERIRTIQLALYTRMALAQLGYDVGPFTTLDAPGIRAAIEDQQRQLGMVVTGRPSEPLLSVLAIRLRLLAI